jgi:SAM-dependent methyltransferase
MIDGLVKYIKSETIKSLTNHDGYSLDVGCWDRKYTNCMPNSIGVEQLKEYDGVLTNPNYFCNLEDLCFFDGYFSNVGMFDVAEHLENPIEVFKEVHRVLKKDGIFIIIDPNDGNIKIARYLALRPNKARLGNPDHLYKFDEKDFVEMLDSLFVLERKIDQFIFTGYRFRKV